MSKIKNMEFSIPERMEVNCQDKFNYATKYGMSNNQLQAILSIKNRLDIDVLKRAVYLSLYAEPILGCTFIEDINPYWNRIKNIEDIEWFTYQKTSNIKQSIYEFIKKPIGLNGNQQVQVKLFRTEKEDTICIKLNHACSDAYGLKYYIYKLADLYAEICKDNNYIPKINISKRDQRKYFEALGIDNPLSLFEMPTPSNIASWSFPHDSAKDEYYHASLYRFTKDQFIKIKKYYKDYAVTINTLILTAFFRAMFTLTNAKENDKKEEIQVTINLRSFLKNPNEQGICNLSSTMNPKINNIDEGFIGTLKRVKIAIDEAKKTKGLNNAIFMEALGELDYNKELDIVKRMKAELVKADNSAPALSNFGIINNIHFANIEVDDAYIVPPCMSSPGFMLGVSTYKDILTLAVSYYEPSIKSEDVDKLFELMKENLTV